MMADGDGPDYDGLVNAKLGQVLDLVSLEFLTQLVGNSTACVVSNLYCKCVFNRDRWRGG